MSGYRGRGILHPPDWPKLTALGCISPVARQDFKPLLVLAYRRGPVEWLEVAIAKQKTQQFEAPLRNLIRISTNLKAQIVAWHEQGRLNLVAIEHHLPHHTPCMQLKEHAIIMM